MKVDEKGRKVADWDRRKLAAVEICKMAGVTDLVRATSLDNRPAPQWPECDIVPTGGGPGLLRVEVRTHHPVRGIMRIPMGIAAEKNIKEQLGEALERGKFELKKQINS